MPNLVDRYIDLIASGDEAKIKCVTTMGAAGAVTGGVGTAVSLSPSNGVPIVGSGVYAVGVAISAVVGLLIGINAGMKTCGQGTEGSFGRLFSGMVSHEEMTRWKAALQQRGVGSREADALIKASIVELQTSGLTKIDRSAPLNVNNLNAVGAKIGGMVAARV